MQAMLLASEKAIASYQTSKTSSVKDEYTKRGNVDRALLQVLASRRAEKAELASQVANEVRFHLHHFKQLKLS